MSSRPLTPPYVPSGIRRFNSLSALPRIFWLYHHSQWMRGICLLMTCAGSNYRQYASIQDGNKPILWLSAFVCLVVGDYRISQMVSSTASRRFVLFFCVSIHSKILFLNSFRLWNSTQAILPCISSYYLKSPLLAWLVFCLSVA